jgi:signal peptidase II
MQRMFSRRRSAGSFTIFGFVVAVLVLIADQASKYWILYGLDLDGRTPQQVQVLDPWFNLTMVWNHGVSFGMFQADSDLQRYLLAGVSLAIAGMLIVWMFQTTRRLQALAFALIIGGAIGNVIDRLIYGAVVDFFDFSGLYFPYVFNVADAGICIGVAVMILDLIVNGDR